MDNPSVNRPGSGTYGEGADLARLRQSLPKGAIGNPGPPPQGGPPMGPPPVGPHPALPMPTAPGRPDTGGAPAPPGIPPVLLGPTNQPNTPVSTPLAGPPTPAPQQTPGQSRLNLLYMLANSQEVDPTTREWAQVVIEKLLGPGAANTPTLGQPPSAPSPAPAPQPVVGRG